jgi:small subunit ribosomal protein S2
MSITAGWAATYTKKEILGFQREFSKLQKSLIGIKNMDRLPGAIFVIDPRKERIAINEANKLQIPIVAIVDTNCDPDGIQYPIPGNDDAIRAIGLFNALVADACLEGLELRQERLRTAAEGEEPSEEPRLTSTREGDKIYVSPEPSKEESRPEEEEAFQEEYK